MSDIKFPPLPDELNKDILRSIAWDFAKAAVELNRPQVPKDTWLDAMMEHLTTLMPSASSAIGSLRYRVATVEADLDKAREEIEALRADADRYRWLRSNFNGRLFAIESDSFQGDTILMLEQLDAAIDAARGKK